MATITNILLTGASGTVGQELLKCLVANPEFRITVFDIDSRRAGKLRSVYQHRVVFVAGDISSATDVQKIPAGMDVVIHLAALIPPLADKYPQLTHNINVMGTSLLVSHVQRTSPNVFFIYSSSVSVYGDRMQNPYIRVSDALSVSEGDVYGQSKLDAETIVRNSPLRWTIFRLAAIMKNHKMSKLMFHMPLDTKFEICTPEDTARAFLHAIFKSDLLKGRIFNLGGGESCCMTYREFLEKSFKIYGLGSFNFPKYAFAEHNFHCGRMLDGDDLEHILNFRQDTFQSYFEKTKNDVNPFIRYITILFRPIIKWVLLAQSEPYRAYRTQNKLQLNHFFKLQAQ
jgi:nucleoside-diphosphate-sugar epimerase